MRTTSKKRVKEVGFVLIYNRLNNGIPCVRNFESQKDCLTAQYALPDHCLPASHYVLLRRGNKVRLVYRSTRTEGGCHGLSGAYVWPGLD